MKSCISSKNVVVRTYVWTALESLNIFMLAIFFVCMIERSGDVVEITWIKDGCPQPRMFRARTTCLIPRCQPDYRAHLDLV